MVKNINKEEFDKKWDSPNYISVGYTFSDKRIAELKEKNGFKGLKKHILNIEKTIKTDLYFYCFITEFTVFENPENPEFSEILNKIPGKGLAFCYKNIKDNGKYKKLFNDILERYSLNTEDILKNRPTISKKRIKELPTHYTSGSGISGVGTTCPLF